jgi:predicted lipoprotein with Yx(FWY)xxD motif
MPLFLFIALITHLMRSSATAITALIVAIIAIIGIWYWYTYASGAPSPSTTMGLNDSPDQGNLGASSTGTVQQPGGMLLNVASDSAGNSYLTAYNGMTLYVTSKDTMASSTCTGSCASTWPPYTTATASSLTPGAGITGAVGTITRSDGSMQITYRGIPLYFYSADSAPGQETGQGFGGVWSVATP